MLPTSFTKVPSNLIRSSRWGWRSGWRCCRLRVGGDGGAADDGEAGGGVVAGVLSGSARFGRGGVSRSDGGDDAEGSGVAGISGGSAGSSSGETGSSVISSGVAGDGWSDGGAG